MPLFLVAPTVAASVTVAIVGSVVAVTIIWSVIAISVAVIATTVMSPGVSVVVGNLFSRGIAFG